MWKLEYPPFFQFFHVQENPATVVLAPAPPIAIIHHLYPADYSDNTILLGSSHNVFIGKVIAQVSTKDFLGNPATQFSVEVISNIKGDTKSTIVVNQEGGYKDGVLYLMEEGSALLQPGATYLLATRYDSEGGYYTLNPHPNASKLLSSDANLDKKEIKALADKDAKVKSLEAAYPDEIPLEADIAHNNTRNSYHSLPAEAKAIVDARAQVAKASIV